MGLPNFLQSYLPSYDVKKLDRKNPAVAVEVITQVLNLGDEKAVNWVFTSYPLTKIKEAIEKPQRGTWDKKSLDYWAKMLEVSKVSGYKDAIMNLNIR